VNRLLSLVQRRRWSVVALWLLALVAAAPLALQLPGTLSAGGFTDPRSESAAGADTLREVFADDPDALVVVLHDAGGQVTDAVPDARSAIEEVPRVSSVSDTTEHPEWTSADGRTTILQVGFDADETTVQNSTPVLGDEVERALAGRDVEVDVTGAPALDYALNVNSQRDVERAELLPFPVLVVVLFLAFRSLVAMLVPVVLAGVTVVITNGIGTLVARSIDLSILFTNAVSMIGLAVAVDYSLFVVKRFREELHRGTPVAQAVQVSMRTAGHSVMFSGVAVVIALAALFTPRIMVFSSIALGGALVTLVALAVTATLLPAVLLLLGHRIDKGTLPTRPPAVHRREGRRPGSGLLRGAHSRPALAAALALVLFGALAWPVVTLTLRVPVASASILPPGEDARQGIERITSDLGLQDLFPVQVVLSADADDAASLLRATAAVNDAAAGDPRVVGAVGLSSAGLPAEVLDAVAAGQVDALPAPVRAAVEQFWADDDGRLVSRVVLTPRGDPDSAQTHELVTDLRAELDGLIGPDVDAAVTGATAGGVDFDRAVIRFGPVIVAGVLMVTLLMLTLAFRSLVLPLLAIAFNVLVVGSSMGVLSLLFQHGPGGSINSVTPVLLFAVTFGLSMDYMVIMIARIRELRLAGQSHREAVLGGVARTAGMVNSAALIMIAVFASFATADIEIVAQLGVGLAIAVALDAVVIRLFVLPATLLLIGPRVWGRRHRAGVHAGPPTPVPTPTPSPAAAERPVLVGAGGDGVQR
jgi:RND superfamily putative drug exporter